MITGVETNADNKSQLGSQTVLWQRRNSHIPKRKKKTNRNPNCLQNKDATNSNAFHNPTLKQALPQVPIEEEGVRGVHSNF